MSLTNDQITAKNFKEFYQKILPYLGTMPEVLANKFSKGDMYSTSEKMIGQWIDGKPLYQKTITGTGSADISLGTDIDACVYIQGFLIQNYSPYINYMPISFKDADSSVISAWFMKTISTNEGIIRFAVSSAYTSLPYYVTLQYTKTTD